jgi:hypothetical protein
LEPIANTCGYFWDFRPSDCAAWAQSWGTVLAVLGAVAIAWWQGKRARRERVEDRAQRYAEIYAPALALGDETVRLFQELYDELFLQRALAGFGPNPRLWLESDALEALVLELAPTSMPTYKSILSVRRLIREVSAAKLQLQNLGDRAQRPDRPLPERQDEFTHTLASIQRECDILRADLVAVSAPK